MGTIGWLALQAVRRGWRATVVVAVIAGLAAGTAMAAWSIGRRTGTAVDRFLEEAEPADLMVTFCPPGATPSGEGDLFACFLYDPVDEVATIAALPEVELAVSASFRGVAAARPGSPDDTWMSSSLVGVVPRLPGPEGRLVLSAGRWFDPRAADEVVVNEAFADHTGTGVGDELDLTFWSQEELGASKRDGDRFSGPEAKVRIVGVGRGVADLGSQVGRADTLDSLRVVGGPALADATAGAGGFSGVLVRGRPGVEDLEQVLTDAFPGRAFNIAPGLARGEVAPVRDAISYEARAVLVFAALVAVAALAVVGQTAARQSRREWSDGRTLAVLGVERRQLVLAAALRGTATGVLAAGVAAAVTVALSPLGPWGVARGTVADRAVSADAVVLVLGGLAVLLAVVVSTALALAVEGRRPSGGPRSGSARLLGAVAALPLPAAVGGRMAQRSVQRGGAGLPIGTALVSVALAVGTAAAAGVLTTSLGRLVDEPRRFGVSWDLSVSGRGTTDDGRTELAALSDRPEVHATAAIVGTDVEIDGEVVWVHAVEPLTGAPDAITPVITSGRAPTTAEEVALGAITADELGVGTGDVVRARSTVSGSSPVDLTVVGTAIVNDTYEESPGRGGIVAPAWMERHAPEIAADPFLIDLVPGVDPEAFRASVQDAVEAEISGPVRQGAIRNVDRIAGLPSLLAVVVSGLALASFAHALVLSVGRQRRDLAVLKSLGFERLQVAGSVAACATALAAPAALVGIPVGIAGGRWLWRLVAERIGVASGPVASSTWVLVAVVAALVAANLVGAVPAWRAARLRTGAVLRVE